MSLSYAIGRLSVPEIAGSLVLAGATAAIVVALLFEHVGGYEPCPLCLQQRWAYYGGIPLVLAALIAALAGYDVMARGLLLVAGIAFALNAGLGVYHSGIEWKLWPGPASCVAAQDLAAEAGALLERLKDARLVPCDEARWRFLGLSFAGWNAVISAGLAVVALFGALRGNSAAP